MPGVHRRRRAGEADRLAAEADVAGVALVDAEEDAGHLGPPGADQARERRRSRRPGPRSEMSRNSPTRVRPSTSSSTSPTAVATFGKSETDRPTMCRTRSAVVRSRVGGRHDVAPVAEHGRAVAQLEDLVEAVADEQDRDAAVAQPADDA